MFSEFRKHESCFTATFARRKTLRYRPIATHDSQILRDAGESKPTEKSFPVHFLLSGAISPPISVRCDPTRVAKFFLSKCLTEPVQELISRQDAKRAKVTDLGQSSRATARDPRKIS